MFLEKLIAEKALGRDVLRARECLERRLVLLALPSCRPSREDAHAKTCDATDSGGLENVCAEEGDGRQRDSLTSDRGALVAKSSASRGQPSSAALRFQRVRRADFSSTRPKARASRTCARCEELDVTCKKLAWRDVSASWGLANPRRSEVRHDAIDSARTSLIVLMSRLCAAGPCVASDV